jgi:hypothetical protein
VRLRHTARERDLTGMPRQRIGSNCESERDCAIPRIEQNEDRGSPKSRVVGHLVFHR